MPHAPTWLGDQESQAIPALAITNDTHTETLVQGQLRQDRTRLRWRVGAHPHAMWGVFEFGAQAHGGQMRVMPGESMTIEPIFFQALQNVPIDRALDDYYDRLTREPAWHRGENELRHSAIYCSWNYGIMREIDHDSLAERARFIGKHLPGIRFFLIDGGWVPWPDAPGQHMGNFHQGADAVCDPQKFPKGMKAIADDIRDAGLRPALHWTPFVNLNSSLARDRPEWLLRNQAGGIYCIGSHAYLDPSVPEVRHFLESDVIDVITKQWGFEGIKMDFWSQCFESSDVRYRNGGTGIEWRDWFLHAIRSRLPTNGFLMTCVAVAMGNPFLGKSADTYRGGFDIGHASSWWEHVRACYWTLPMLSQPGRRTSLINMDGLGISEHYTERENIHRLTWGFITMGSLEIDGKLETLDAAQLKKLERLTTDIDRGHPCYCADDQAFTGEPLPRVLYVTYPADSPTRQRGIAKHLALLNWTNESRWITATGHQLDIDDTVQAREFWTDEQATFQDGHVCRLLPPHGAELWEVCD